jgi:hypothetical protein
MLVHLPLQARIHGCIQLHVCFEQQDGSVIAGDYYAGSEDSEEKHTSLVAKADFTKNQTLRHHSLFPHSTSLPSPISVTPNTPSPIPFHFSASASFLGGSNTSSSVNTHVPQCIPSAVLHFVSTKIFTASFASACTALHIHRGSYAPIGMRPRSKGPRCWPICANAGQTGRCE